MLCAFVKDCKVETVRTWVLLAVLVVTPQIRLLTDEDRLVWTLYGSDIIPQPMEYHRYRLLATLLRMQRRPWDNACPAIAARAA
jgi:hypothetical protein